MNVMEGLSNWLRQIIAVVLLASIVDLLLPNRTMQRYVRLVAGLFILMTLATPILHWMKGDFSSKLTEGLNAVEREPQGAVDQLAMIEAEGAKLRDKQSLQAAKLVTAKLESAIRDEVEQSEQRQVRKVDVVLERVSNGSLTIAKVVIVLEPEPSKTGDRSSPPVVKEVEPIAAVDIHVQVEEWPDAKVASPDTSRKSDQAVAAEAEAEADRVTRSRISALVANRFGMAASIVEVKLPIVDTANPY
ncbi:stage III sporulation protein AF [Cohnella abietis]|uniref:Stage III sporulation protein AF n=1 Tax=Cohnella abietis TaxID=2507935 RepID=A0A3T1D4N4_9BACL|nr:stage III sporulation protein AF [Cohnella abietis]BBI33073.1 hypothetical protein KCTCHS21_24720 [Cohnella abietis]